MTLILVISVQTALTELTSSGSSETDSPDQSGTVQDKSEPISVGDVLRDFEQTILETEQLDGLRELGWSRVGDRRELDREGRRERENETSVELCPGKPDRGTRTGYRHQRDGAGS